jgi:hypothetical protein
MTTQDPPTRKDQTATDSDNSGKRGDSGDLSTAQVVGSTLAAAFGVQSKENKVRDFERGKPHQFIIAGVVFTLLFLAGMIALVNFIV